MGNQVSISVEQVRLLAEAVDLHLPEDALEKLAQDYSSFLAGFVEIYKIDVGDREPAVLVPSSEAER